MVTLEQLLEGDLRVAVGIVAELIPDVIASLDVLMPQLQEASDRLAVRRFMLQMEVTVEDLVSLPVVHPDVLPPLDIVKELVRRSIPEVLWIAPTVDGLGAVTVLVDRLRGFSAGIPQTCVAARQGLDPADFEALIDVIDEVEFERRNISPLRRAMRILDLSSTEVAGLMGVSRQAVEKWLLIGPPTDRSNKIGAMAEVAQILNHRLLAGMPAIVARRPAEAYGGKTMLELIAENRHEWLRESVKRSFDFTQVA